MFIFIQHEILLSHISDISIILHFEIDRKVFNFKMCSFLDVSDVEILALNEFNGFKFGQDYKKNRKKKSHEKLYKDFPTSQLIITVDCYKPSYLI